MQGREGVQGVGSSHASKNRRESVLDFGVNSTSKCEVERQRESLGCKVRGGDERRLQGQAYDYVCICCTANQGTLVSNIMDVPYLPD